jgi:hypothetical protein
MLRHQLSIALREQPRAHSRLTWPDRAWLALLAGTLPIDRLTAIRLIVTPGTVLRWHRDIARCRWARRSRGACSRPRQRTHHPLAHLVGSPWGAGGVRLRLGGRPGAPWCPAGGDVGLGASPGP